MPTRSTVVRIAVGVFLLVTAGLKLYGLGTSAVPRVGWFAQPWVQLLAIEWELVLGAWLLSGRWPRASWLLAVLTFGAFAAVSGYLGWVGVASCGCFGVIKTNPWWAFGIDVIAFSLLAVSRSRGQEVERVSGACSRAASVAVAVAIIVLIGSLVFGSTEVAVARLRGETVTVDQRSINFGDGKPGDDLQSVVTVFNWSSQPLKLIGGTTDCSCLTTSDLPVLIPPGESRKIAIHLKVPTATPGTFTREAQLWTDHEHSMAIRIRLACRITE